MIQLLAWIVRPVIEEALVQIHEARSAEIVAEAAATGRHEPDFFLKQHYLIFGNAFLQSDMGQSSID
jgi:hypothetical protein